MLEKTVRMNALFDFYHPLLTDKQRRYLSLYYLDDLSLGEIAAHFSVSRQAVYDNIRRTEEMLEQFERRLRLYEKEEARKKLLAELKRAVKKESSGKKELLRLVEALEAVE